MPDGPNWKRGYTKELFQELFQGKVLEFRRKGKALPQHSFNQTAAESVKNYVYNSLWAIEQRGEALKKILK